MKAVLAQIDVVPGRPDLNVSKMLKRIKEAKENNADVICFSEMCVGGYFVADKYLEDAYCEDLMLYNDVLKEASDGICIIYGNVYLDKATDGWKPNKDGRTRRYNAAYVFQNKVSVARDTNFEWIELIRGIQIKTLLPNYRIFRDQRYFLSFKDYLEDNEYNFNYLEKLEDFFVPFSILLKDGTKAKIGVELCEDLWCKDYRFEGKSINVSKFLIQNGAEFIFNLSASPWTFGKNAARDNRIQEVKEDAGKFVPYIYVNCVGCQNTGNNFVNFDGGSTVYNDKGKVILMSKKSFIEDFLIYESQKTYNSFTRPAENKIAKKYNAIITTLTHLDLMLGMKEKPRFVVGLSGGVDSGLAACLLTLALGKNRVILVNIPSKYNSIKTKNIAKHIAEGLDIELRVTALDEIMKVADKAISYGSDNKNATQLNEENEQARIRGSIILAGIAARENALFSNNGNKLEIALGYATLYGDTNGAVAINGDLTKVEVFQMADFLNKKVFKQEVIPNQLLPNDLFEFDENQVAPSAELKENQIDPMKFGYHDALLEAFTDYRKKSPEDILEYWLNGELAEKLGIDNKIIQRYSLDKANCFLEDLEWFCKKMQQNVFKRIQSPPIIITSKSSYGDDIMESQLPWRKTNRYKELETKLKEINF